MNRLFRVLASCLFATVIALGSLVGGAFAQTTPSPEDFTMVATQAKIVRLNPQKQSFTATYTTPGFQQSTVSVFGGTCPGKKVTIPQATIGQSNTYSCGSVSLVNFENEGPGRVEVHVSQ